MSGGKGLPALGGRELSRNARTTRSSFNADRISSCHSTWAFSTRLFNPERIWSVMCRLSSSRAASSAATKTVLRSRISTSSIEDNAASARSRHSAIFSCGRSDSARFMRASARTSSPPSSADLAFWVSISFRTAAIPPRDTCSAMTCCSSGSEATKAFR